jgi:hypothetical protein
MLWFEVNHSLYTVFYGPNLVYVTWIHEDVATCMHIGATLQQNLFHWHLNYIHEKILCMCVFRRFSRFWIYFHILWWFKFWKIHFYFNSISWKFGFVFLSLEINSSFQSETKESYFIYKDKQVVCGVFLLKFNRKYVRLQSASVSAKNRRSLCDIVAQYSDVTSEPEFVRLMVWSWPHHFADLFNLLTLILT